MTKVSNTIFLILSIILSNSLSLSSNVQVTKLMTNSDTLQGSLTRFVKLQMGSTGDKALNLSQIECFNKNGENVTKGKTVTTNFSSPYKTNPNILTDGILTERNPSQIYHPADNNKDWVLIDLVKPQEITKCTIYKNCCDNILYGARLGLLNSNSSEFEFKIFSTEPENSVEFGTAATLTPIIPTDTTRFIKLQMANTGDKAMNLSQIACFNTKNENVTKGKTVTANAPSPYGISPNNLTDGNLKARPHPQSFHSANGNNDWVSIDLTSSQNISRCVIYNRSDCCGERLIGAKLSLLDLNNNEVKSSIVSTGNAENTISFEPEIRIIRLQMDSTGDKVMNLSQIACFNIKNENVTKGKTVTANAPSPYGMSANNLTDGNLSARPHPQSFHSANANNDWVSIDLGSSQQISRCEIYNRSDCCGQRVIGAKLMLMNGDTAVYTKTITEGNSKITISFP